MSTETFVGVIFPIFLVVLMGGVGLTLRWHDFMALKESPKTVGFFWSIQLVVVPVLAIALNMIFAVPPIFAAGLLLLASSPGGPSASIFSHLSGGNVALNVALTAANSILSVVYIPLLLFIGSQLYAHGNGPVVYPVERILQIVAIILIPLALGMWVREKKTAWALAVLPLVNPLSIVFILSVSVFGIYKEGARLLMAFSYVGLPVILLNISCIGIAYIGSLALKLSRRDQIAATFELGVHNSTLPIGLAASPFLLNSFDMAIAPALYGIFMNFTAASMVWFFRRTQSEKVNNQ